MSIAQTTTTSFRVELFEAVHDFTTDVFFIALYTGTADIGPTTTAYTTIGEASGTGYATGGQRVYVTTLPTYGNDLYGFPTAYIGFGNTTWNNASFTARGALIYNVSKGNKSVAVLDFGADKTVTGTDFTVQFPVADPNSAIVRIS